MTWVGVFRVREVGRERSEKDTGGKEKKRTKGKKRKNKVKGREITGKEGEKRKTRQDKN